MCDKESMIEKDKCSFGHGHRKVCFAVLPLWASTDWFIRLIESVRGWRVKGGSSIGRKSDFDRIHLLEAVANQSRGLLFAFSLFFLQGGRGQ